MPFLFFILLNAVMLIRPADFIPAMAGLPLYNVLILACLASSFPVVIGQLSSSSLAERPITACVLGLLAAIVLASLSHLDLYGLRRSADEFYKVVLYYLLLVGVVDSVARLRQFLFWLGVFIFILATISLLQYHGYIDLEALAPYLEHEFDDSGDEVLGVIRRLNGAGIFNNPNAISRILVVGMGLSIYRLGDARSGPLRFGWALPLLAEGYALLLTQSRGGIMALLASLAVVFGSRVGWKKTFVIGAVVLPALLLASKGRQGEISTNAGTAQERIRLWRDGWMLLQHAPVFGIGMNQYAEEVGMVAHNSYFHCYVELGFFGGAIFAGMIYQGIASLARLTTRRDRIADPHLGWIISSLLAILSGEAVGMLSISRSYHVPTYLLLGLATCCNRLASDAEPSLRVERSAGRLAAEVAAVGAVALLFMYGFIVTSVK